MRILVLSNLCPPNFVGGYEIGALKVAEQLVKRGHEVRLLTSASWHEAAGEPEFIVRCFEMTAHTHYPSPSRDIERLRGLEARVSNFQNSSALLDHLATWQPDVTYVFNVYGIGGLALIDILTGLSLPWVWHLMDDVPGALLDGVEAGIREIFAADDAISSGPLHIAMSEKLIRECRRGGLSDKADVTVIPGWVDAASGYRRQGYRRDGLTRFVFAGYVGEHKGVPRIMDAARRLLAEGSDRFRIDFYGPGDLLDSELRSARLGLSQHLFFHGPVSHEQTLQALAESDCLLFPTWEREPFGFIALEACAAGCVVVMTNVCGAAERLVGGVHVVKIRRETDDLFQSMRQLVHGGIDIARMGRIAANYVNDTLTLDKLAASIEATLLRAISRRRAAKPKPAEIDVQRRLQWMKTARALELHLA